MLNGLFKELLIILLVGHVLSFESLNNFFIEFKRLELNVPVKG